MDTITWSNKKLKLSQLIPWNHNPKTISKDHARRLLNNWKQLGQWQTMAVGPGGEVYDGHQRLSVLLAAYGPDYDVSVLQSSRPLTDDERKQVVVEGSAGAIGQFNWDELAGWDAEALQGWGLDGETLKDWQTNITALGNFIASNEVPEFKEYDETIADDIQICKCPVCGNEHASKKD